jgi:hypothetical protein
VAFIKHNSRDGRHESKKKIAAVCQDICLILIFPEIQTNAAAARDNVKDE